VDLVAEYVRTQPTGQALLAVVAAGLLCYGMNGACLTRTDRVAPELRLIISGVALLPLPLGAHIRFRLLPGVVAGRRVALSRWARLELTTMGIAFGLGTALAHTPAVRWPG
jgi:hypothetical protein